MITKYPRLIILQTLSKAWGAAGIRLGLAFASVEILGLLNKVKPPYNINVLTQQKALEVLRDESRFLNQVDEIKSERTVVASALKKMNLVKKVHPSNTNFLLVEFENPLEVFQYLRAHGVVVRDRTKTHLCDNCLRITIGTPTENSRLLQLLNTFEKEVKA